MFSRSIDLIPWELEWSNIALFILIGVSTSCEALELTMLSFLQDCVATEWDLSVVEKQLLTSAVFGGQILGLLLFGPLADMYGRRIIIIIGWSMISAFGLASSLSPNVWCLALLRGFVGIGIGSHIISYDLLAEISPRIHRGRIMSAVMIFFPIGEIFVAGLAYSTLNKYGWRWFTFYAALPTLVQLVFSLKYVPESPLWLRSKGYQSELNPILPPNEIRLTVQSNKPSKLSDPSHDVTILELFSSKSISIITTKVWILWYEYSKFYI